MRVLSLGWGTQSFALAAMSAIGVLPRVDAAIHADTTHERSETYDFARRWTPWLEERGVRVVTVRNDSGNRLTRCLEQADNQNIILPAYTTWLDGHPSGQVHRECTYDWKIVPIRRQLRRERDGAQVEQWLGITLDEVERARLSGVKYICNVYPFLDMRMRRGDVIRWLQEHGLEVPVKSSCVFCPFHDRMMWREIKLSGNGDWEKAIRVDETIRHKCPGYVCYLTRELKPLAECDFSSQEDHGQMTLWSEECTGYCFV